MFFNINTFKHDFHEQINRILYRKIVKHLKNINLYINALKFMNERLTKNKNLRNYKLFYKNSHNHDSRIYNRFFSNEIIIV